MADIEGQVPAEEVPQQDAADVAPVTAEEPQIEEQQQDPVQQVADAPTSEPAEEPVAATEQAPAAEETPVDASAAAAAAAAVAARLMASHGQSSDFPVSSGAEHAYGDGNNKRPRDDEAAIDGEGPDKKRASTGLLDGQNGTEAHNPVRVLYCSRPARKRSGSCVALVGLALPVSLFFLFVSTRLTMVCPT